MLMVHICVHMYIVMRKHFTILSQHRFVANVGSLLAFAFPGYHLKALDFASKRQDHRLLSLPEPGRVLPDVTNPCDYYIRDRMMVSE